MRRFSIGIVLSVVFVSCSSEASIGDAYCGCFDLPSEEIEPCKSQYYDTINKLQFDNPAEFVQVRNQIRNCEANHPKEGK